MYLTETYLGLHLMCYNLYIGILLIVLSTYNLSCSFIYANFWHYIEVILHIQITYCVLLISFLAIGYIDLTKYGAKNNSSRVSLSYIEKEMLT